MSIFFETGIPNWRIVFEFRSDIGDKGFKQDPDIFGREGTHNLVSTNVSSGKNMLYVMRPFEVSANIHTKVFHSSKGSHANLESMEK